MGQVIFRCPKNGQEFDSGFQAVTTELKLLPRPATIHLRCAICGKTHEFSFADARIEQKPSRR